MTTDETRERRNLWRHMIQCVLAEHQARQVRDACPPGSRFRDRAEVALDAEGVRLNAAIEALDETLLKAGSAA